MKINDQKSEVIQKAVAALETNVRPALNKLMTDNKITINKTGIRKLVRQASKKFSNRKLQWDDEEKPARRKRGRRGRGRKNKGNKKGRRRGGKGAWKKCAKSTGGRPDKSDYEDDRKGLRKAFGRWKKAVMQ